VIYAENEVLHPRRIVTTSILVDGGEWPLVSVKTSCPVPKNAIFPIMEMVQKIRIKAPVSLGQVIIENVLDTNADIISTKSVKKSK
jgi:CxxC motif-containing protein